MNLIVSLQFSRNVIYDTLLQCKTFDRQRGPKNGHKQ